MSKRKSVEAQRKSVEAFLEMNKRHNEQGAFTRMINQLLALFDFHQTTGPYAPYVTFAKDTVCYIFPNDTSFTWTHLKSAKIRSILKMTQKLITGNTGIITKEFVKKHLGLSEDTYTRLDIAKKIKKIITSYTSLYPEANFANDLFNTLIEPNISLHDEHATPLEDAIITKLYHITSQETKDALFDTTEQHGKKYITINELGCEHFTGVLHDLFHYFSQNNYPGKNREDFLFPNKIFGYTRNKILKKEPLTEKEIREILVFLIRDFTDQEIQIASNGGESTTTRDKIKIMKKLFINLAYEAIYNEQLYDYYTIKNIFEGWASNTIEDAIYTERNIKELGSLANKGIRRQQINDLVRARSWLPDTCFKEESQQTKITEICTQEIENFISQAKKQGYDIIIDDLEIISKFPETRSSDQSITISKKTKEMIKKGLQQNFSAYFAPGEESASRNVGGDKETNKLTQSHNLPLLPYMQSEKDQFGDIAQAFDHSSKKGGGNTGYADIKVKITYRLQHRRSKKIIDKTGGFEHMLCNYGSLNESGLSDHNIIFDPKKIINNMCNTMSTIGMDVIHDQVIGGLDKLIIEMKQRESMLQAKKWEANRPPKNLIKKQFALRNIIPEEFSENEKGLTTYSSLEGHPVQKKIIEHNIEKYLLNLMLNEHQLQWFLYDVDKNVLGETGTEMNFSLNKMHNNTYTMDKNTTQEFINNAFHASEEQKKNYRLCGGGNGNLANSLEKGTYHLNSYIGFSTAQGTIIWIKTARLMGIIADNKEVPQEGVKLKDFLETRTNDKNLQN